MDCSLMQETKQQSDKIDRQIACVEGYEVRDQHFALCRSISVSVLCSLSGPVLSPEKATVVSAPGWREITHL